MSFLALWWLIPIECLCFSELPDFLNDDESTRIIDLAEMFGLENSYMHSDEFQEQHKKDVKGNQSIFICS